MLENNIHLEVDGVDGEDGLEQVWWNAFTTGRGIEVTCEDNPFRAAMICFLKIKELLQ